MKKSVKQGIIGAVVAVVAFAGAMAIFNRDNSDEKTLTSWDYKIAGLDSAGKVDSDEKGTIVTKDYYKLDELKDIEIENEDYLVQVFGYDADKLLMTKLDVEDMSATEFAEFKNTLREANVEYVKFTIEDAEDDEISIFEKGKVAKGATITFSTETSEE